MFKADIEAAATSLHKIVAEVWNTETIPDSMKDGLIIKLPKKGNLGLCSNYRGIVLLNTINKLISLIVLNRISPVIEPKLRNEQAGFRPNRSCTDQVNTLRIIVEQCMEFRSPLFLLFIDFERAFDSLNRDYMWKVLVEYGIPSKLIVLIKELYSGCSYKVMHKGKLGTPFQVCSGVKQGDILSPLLFLIVLDHVMKKANSQPRGIQWSLVSRLEDLDYADDICSLSHNFSDLQQKLQALVHFAKPAGLKVNVAKTKLMILNTRCTSKLQIDGQDIEVVEKFCYLGSMITKGGGAEEDVSCRIQKARQAFGSFKRVWASTKLSRRLKLQIFNSNIKSVLLYGCETWKVTRQTTSRIQVFVNRCLRQILRIYWPNVITNENLHRMTGQRKMSDEIGHRKWGWIGHTLRKPANDISRHAMSWNPQGTRRPGCPKATWRRTILKEAKAGGKCWSEVVALAQSRTRWRCFIDALRII